VFPSSGILGGVGGVEVVVRPLLRWRISAIDCGPRAAKLLFRLLSIDKRPVLGQVVRLAQSVLLNISIRFGFQKARGLPHVECR
jgi:hypothetical protein